MTRKQLDVAYQPLHERMPNVDLFKALFLRNFKNGMTLLPTHWSATRGEEMCHAKSKFDKTVSEIYLCQAVRLYQEGSKKFLGLITRNSYFFPNSKNLFRYN